MKATSDFWISIFPKIWSSAFVLIFDFRYYQGLINVFTGDPAKEIDPLAEIDPNIEVIIEDPLNSGLNIKTTNFAFKIGLVFKI